MRRILYSVSTRAIWKFFQSRLQTRMKNSTFFAMTMHLTRSWPSSQLISQMRQDTSQGYLSARSKKENAFMVLTVLQLQWLLIKDLDFSYTHARILRKATFFIWAMEMNTPLITLYTWRTTWKDSNMCRRLIKLLKSAAWNLSKF